jgi:hypothetical protein
MSSPLNRCAWYLMLAGGALLVVGAIASFYVKGKWQRAQDLAEEPRRIRLADLIANGPGDNPRVTVTDFACGQRFVYLSKQEQVFFTRKEIGWGMVWIPLYPREADPREGEKPPGKAAPIRALLATPQVHDKELDVQILNRRASLEGLATRVQQGGKLDEEVRAKLKESYPEADFSDYLFIEEIGPYTKESAQEEAYAFLAAVAGGFGLGSAGVLLGLFLWNLDRKRTTADVDGPGLTPGRRQSSDAP